MNIFGAKESTGINVTLAVIDFLTQLLLVLIGAVLVLSPEQLVDNVHLGVAPEWSDFILAIPIGMLAYTGIETVSNMAEEAKDEVHTIPAAINRVRSPCSPSTSRCPPSRSPPCPCSRPPTGSTRRGSASARRTAASPAIPCSAWSSRSTWGRSRASPRSTSACWPRRSSSSPPTRASSASRGSSTPWASTARCPTRCASLHPRFRTPWIGILVFAGAAIVLILPGQEALLGSIYSFGALLSFTIAHASVARLRAKRPDIERPYRGPGNLQHRRLRRAALRARRRLVHGDRLRGDRRPQPGGRG